MYPMRRLYVIDNVPYVRARAVWYKFHRFSTGLHGVLIDGFSFIEIYMCNINRYT